jgi:hypothetical protein
MELLKMSKIRRIVGKGIPRRHDDANVRCAGLDVEDTEQHNPLKVRQFGVSLLLSGRRAPPSTYGRMASRWADISIG